MKVNVHNIKAQKEYIILLLHNYVNEHSLNASISNNKIFQLSKLRVLFNTLQITLST